MRGRTGRFVELVGDPDSGLGFYPLPIRYRIGAWRYRVPPQRPPWQNPVLFAIAADAARGQRRYLDGVADRLDFCDNKGKDVGLEGFLVWLRVGADLTVSGLAKALPYSWMEQEQSIGL